MSSEPVSPTSGWRDKTLDTATRVAALMAQMTVEEKVAQLYGVWVGADSAGAGVAPHQHDLAVPPDFDELITVGIGQLTRPFGTAPVDPVMGARGVANSQRAIVAASRLGIPALVHEECLTGLTAWRASVFPTPLAWGATFDPDLIERMAGAIGGTMRSVGVHQGLAPVLDVSRDIRWGRTEETIGEDPHLVGMVGSAYVRGLEQAGVISTLKHFVGYSASRSGRNLAPVSMGARELADVLLPPFEMALRAGARSVMNSYTDIDGVPVAGDERLLTDLLRDTYGFDGTLVSDYFSVVFLQTLHRVVDNAGDAAALALGAGIDVELPTVNCYGPPLLAAIADGRVTMETTDRAVERVLRQKCELGMLDDDWTAESPAHADVIDFDPPNSRALAHEVAARSLVLLSNDGTLPLAESTRVAVVGPNADASHPMMGCYTFPQHVLVHHPNVPLGIEVPTLWESLTVLGGLTLTYAQGVPVVGGSDADIEAAADLARGAQVCVAVLGDESGMFGRGTSGEGCDVSDLRLPGRQEEFLEALLDTGTPVVLVLLAGRPYDLSRQVARLAAVVCAFFPGEEGGPALANLLVGHADPAGRLPVSFPSAHDGAPTTYLAPTLGRRSEVSSIDPTSLFPFGHGLSYAEVRWEQAVCASGQTWSTDGSCVFSVGLHNLSDRPSHEVVQVYLHDPVAEVVRPLKVLVACCRVDLAAGERAEVTFSLHADLTSFTGRGGQRIVEPGELQLQIAASSADVRSSLSVTLTGPRRIVDFSRAMAPTILISGTNGN